MRGEPARPIVIAAGGTGGHFFPAEALAAELVRRGHRVALMTDGRSGGERSPVFAGREVFVLRGAGVAGRGVRRALQAGGALAAGTLQAKRILGRLEPAAIVGFGGYPSVPPVLAARLLGRRPRVILHEQTPSSAAPTGFSPAGPTRSRQACRTRSACRRSQPPRSPATP